MGVFGVSSRDPYPTSTGTASMPSGFRVEDATTDTFPVLNPPTLHQAKMDDRGRGINSNRLVNHAAAVVAASGYPVEDDATRLQGDYEAAVFLAETQTMLNQAAEESGRRLSALLDDDRMSDADRAELRQVLRAMATKPVDQELADRVSEISNDDTKSMQQKMMAIGTLVRTRFPDPCPAFCNDHYDGETPDDPSRYHRGVVGVVSSEDPDGGEPHVTQVVVERIDYYGMPGLAVVRIEHIEGDGILTSPRAVLRLIRVLVKARQVLRQVRKAGA
jgi:hypothetical protein